MPTAANQERRGSRNTIHQYPLHYTYQVPRLSYCKEKGALQDQDLVIKREGKNRDEEDLKEKEKKNEAGK